MFILWPKHTDDHRLMIAIARCVCKSFGRTPGVTKGGNENWGQTGDKLGTNWGQTGDATARRGLHDGAKEIPDHQDGPGKRVFLGSCECS